MINVLHAAAANLAQPGSGTDLASLCHFAELAKDGQIRLATVSVSPSPIDPAVLPPRQAALFQSDPARNPAAGGAWRKLALLARGGILFQTGFLSRDAADAIAARLAERPDVLLVDHIAALANIPLFRLLALRLRGQTRIVVVSHDISSELLRDRAQLAGSAIRRLAIRLHAAHCHLYEAAVFGLAHRVLFISSDDRARARHVRRSKTDALCPLLDLSPDLAGAPGGEEFGRFLLFVGSPSFFPNAAAIRWIEQQFAPALLARSPGLRVLLAGKGTDRLDPARPVNVIGLGFVAEDRLRRLLRAAAGALSPVVHGSGLKIKVLEAIAAGCPVFATEPSLRGYDFMGLDPLLDVDDPAGSAERVAAIVDDPVRLAEYRDASAGRWRHYAQHRRGRLAEIVRRFGASIARPTREGETVAS